MENAMETAVPRDAGEGNGAVSVPAVEIIKSAEDKKIYRRLTLANGLTVVLIHDPEMAEKVSGRSASGEIEGNGDGAGEGEEVSESEEEDSEDEGIFLFGDAGRQISIKGFLFFCL
jgi:hypothetical protein